MRKVHRLIVSAAAGAALWFVVALLRVLPCKELVLLAQVLLLVGIAVWGVRDGRPAAATRPEGVGAEGGRVAVGKAEGQSSNPAEGVGCGAMALLVGLAAFLPPWILWTYVDGYYTSIRSIPPDWVGAATLLVSCACGLGAVIWWVAREQRLRERQRVVEAPRRGDGAPVTEPPADLQGTLPKQPGP